jgi:N-acetyl-D-muramate 6-phosphate phosphatase
MRASRRPGDSPRRGPVRSRRHARGHRAGPRGRAQRHVARRRAPPLPYAEVRPWVSWGALRLIRLGYGDHLDAARTAELRGRFLACYEACLCRESRLFPGIPEALAALESAAVPWGIVTNKPGWLTEPLLARWGSAIARAP